MVSGFSARADKRKALSGGSGLAWPNARPNDHSTKASTMPNAGKERIRLGTRRGFGFDPVEVGRQAMSNGDSDNLRKFVGMRLADRRLQSGVERRPGLDGDRNFVSCFDFSVPVIK